MMVKIVHRPRRPEVEQTFITAGLPVLLARLLAARNVDKTEHLSASLADLIPPDTLLNNNKMAQLLADAIIVRQKILVVGDFLRA